MNLKCTTDDYDLLYGRWLVNPGSLLDAGGYVPGMKVMDLCGGSGAVSLACLERGAKEGDVMLIDLNPRCKDPRIEQVQGDADRIGPTVFADRQPECLHRFDLIVVRQAAAYLEWYWANAVWLAALLKPQTGKLVFNLFTKPKWSLKTYKHEGRRYFEASCYFDKTVFHLQACPSVGKWDLTKFHHYTKEELTDRLKHVFNIEIVERGKSQTWVCTPRDREIGSIIT